MLAAAVNHSTKGKGLILATAAWGRQGRKGEEGAATCVSRACNYLEVSGKNNQGKKANHHAGKGRYAIPMGTGHPARPAQVTPAHPSRL